MYDVAIVLNYNSSGKTMNLIRTLKTYSFFDDVIVGDNNSSDITDLDELRQLVLDYGYQFIQIDTNKGYAFGNNQLAKTAIAKFGERGRLYVMNPDVGMERDTLVKMKEFLTSENASDGNIVAVAPRFMNKEGLPARTGWHEISFLDHIRFDFFWRAFLGRMPVDYKLRHEKKHGMDLLMSDALLGAFFAIQADSFLEVGMFDERTFLYFEELILGHKLKQKGYASAVMTGISYTHAYGGSDPMTNVVRHEKIMEKSRMIYFKYYRNFGPAKIALYRFFWVTHIIILQMKSILHSYLGSRK